MKAAARIAPLFLLAAAASAQEPHIGYLFPSGARVGGATEIVAGGQFIEKATGLNVSGAGVEASVTGWFKELTNQEINSLRNRREALDQTIGNAQGEERAKLEKELAKILNTFKEQGWDETGRKRLKKFDARRQFNPQLREELSVRLQVAADAAPGPREIRVITPDGLSNPMVFQVGTGAEQREVEPNDRELPADAPALESGEVYNGQIMPGDADRIRVPLRMGERVRFTAQARVLVPYLADAVPGWFQAVLALHDPSGRRVAYADDHLFEPDPVLSYQAPEAGDYVLEIRDAIYRGREDFVYRITRDAGMDPPAPVAAPAGDLAEKEPNDDAGGALEMPVGKSAGGRIGKPGDCDVWRVAGKTGRRLVAELHARRLGSPLDALLQLRDASGKSLAIQDDSEDRGDGLITHHADARLAFAPTADGNVFIEVRDLQQRGGDEFSYRLELRAEQPDFELRTTPASINLAAGGSAPLTVHVLRRDGFAGPVRLRVMDAPGGFHLDGGVIPAGADRVRCTLTVPRNTPAGTRPLVLEGAARIGDREVKHSALPAEDMMQAFLYRHLVRMEQGLLTITGPAKMALAVQEPAGLGEKPLPLPCGGTVKIVLRNALGKKIWGNPHVELSDPPPGLQMGEVKFLGEQNRIEVTVTTDAALCKPGMEGNLVFNLLASSTRKNVLCTAPALPYEITAAP